MERHSHVALGSRHRSTHGFVAVKSFESDFRSMVENLAKTFPTSTRFFLSKRTRGYPHEKAVVDWLQLAAPNAKLKDIRAQISA